jgi:type IV secretory pathway TraG/TraD family ATPase VirD4
MGDGDFFALCRQQGCMGLLATQSVNVLEHSSLKEAWKSVFSNFSAKVFMRCNDNETTEEATKLAGEYDAYVTSQGTSRSKDGLSSSQQKDMRERKNLPTEVLTEVLQRGDAAVVGSLTGSVGRSNLRFLHVPAEWRP